MKLRTFFYSLRQGILNIKRNRMFSLASIGTMTACLFLFGVFYFVLANFRYMLKTAETSVGITVFFDEGISADKIEEVGNTILLRRDVVRIEYLSAEDTWARYKEEALSAELAATFGEDNPLEDSASYIVFSSELEAQSELAEYIRGIDGVRLVNNAEAVAAGLSGINKAIAYVSAVVIVILLTVAAFLISTTISMGVSVRKQEISIMKLIGATDVFIRGPFIVEGVLLGFIGACVPILCLYGIYYKITAYITERFQSVFQQMAFLEIGTVFRVLLPVSLGIGIGIGFFGSYLTLGRALRKIN